MAQRNITAGQVDYVLRHGRVLYRSGITFFILCYRDIPPQDHSVEACTKLAGMVVLVAEGVVLTVYRNDRPVYHVSKKTKYEHGLLSRLAA